MFVNIEYVIAKICIVIADVLALELGNKHYVIATFVHIINMNLQNRKLGSSVGLLSLFVRIFYCEIVTCHVAWLIFLVIMTTLSALTLGVL